MKKWFYVIALMQTGCSPIYYSPTTQNVPLFTEGGQTRIAVGGNTARLELNSAYAITHRLAVQANGGLLFPKDLDNGNGGSGGFIEAGAGYYMPVGDNFVFESFGLVAYGSVENHFPSTVSDNPGTTGNIRSNLVRYGIQPAIGF
ncbi:MAG TPA: hypothetical protein VD905_20250, partial [Flavobacteriales bacterium]|nr:hypothetical protein [Flavobacteriales bacterium]